MYSVVSFDATAEVEVVPTAWYGGGACRWPPYKAEAANRAIRALEAAKEDWPKYLPARLLFSSGMQT